MADMLELTVEEMDRKIAKYEARPTDHQLRGGAPRELAIVLLVGGALGVFASLMLIMSEKAKMANPEAILLCDVNPLIGCGKWIGTWQNEVFFGVSNSVLGLAFFAGLLALGLVLIFEGTFSSWLWTATTAALGAGIVWIFWFAYQSYVVEGSLCPYCVLTWLVTIPMFVNMLARTLQAGHAGKGTMDAGSALVRNRWIIVGIIYGLLVIFTIVWFWDMWPMVF